MESAFNAFTSKGIKVVKMEDIAGSLKISKKTLYEFFSGKKELLDLKIDKDAVDPDDVETLQDMIIAAVNEGLRQIDEMQESEYGKLTGGLNIPGM